MTGYAEAFPAYWAAGWRGILPLPAGRKKHVPTGYTGREGGWPSYPDCQTWADELPNGNVALRLPADVIGIDVDDYDDKDGGGTLAGLVERYGPLPATWTTGSRNDGVSGIRLYRVPAGLQWPGDLGGGIEVIQERHRYAIVWPSKHPNGGTYRWTMADGISTGTAVPRLEELPQLPQAWVDGLTAGRAAQNIQPADLDAGGAVAWLTANGQGLPCRTLERAADRYVHELAAAARSRHEIAKDATMNLCHLVTEGHRGAAQAVAAVRAAFVQAADDRTPDEAAGEWNRLLLGAVRIAAADSLEETDPCDNPFHGLLEASPAAPAALLGPTPAAPPAPAPVAAPDDEWGDVSELLDVDGPAVAVAPLEAPADPVDAPSWAPIDLTQYLDGTWEPELPTMLKRTDGVALVYPGLVHSFHGESESGKSLVAQYLCAVTVQAGQDVEYLDFESGPGPVAARMLAFGCTPAQLVRHFTYTRPEVNPYAQLELPAFRELLGRRPALVVIDGVTDALAQSGASSKDNDDVTKWHRMIPRQITGRTGAAVILIDHVSKDTENRGRYAIGGSAKMNTLDGAAYGVEVVEPIGKGMRGKVSLRVGKDRPGSVRPHCGAWRAGDRTQEACTVLVDSTNADGRIRVTVMAPLSAVGDVDGGGGHHGGGIGYLDGLMEKISRYLEAYPSDEIKESVAVGLAKENTNGSAAQIAWALDMLKAKGHLSKRGPALRLATPYRSREDPDSPSYGGGLHSLIDNGPALPGME